MFFILGLLCYSGAKAQQLSEYSGPFRVGIYQGEASFGYQMVEGDTLYNGPFRFQRSNLESLLADGDETFSIKGSFKDNSPEGAWQFSFGEYRTDSLTEVVDYQYSLSVSGDQHEALGLMRSGKPDGLWTHTLNEIVRSKLEKTLFRSSIRFAEGVPQKSLRIESGSHTLIGRVLRNGRAHDQWTLFSDSETGAIERWTFSEGRLLRIETATDGRWEALPIFEQPGGNQVSIDLDAIFLLLLEWKGLDLKDSHMARLLGENNALYARIDQILSDLGEADYRPGIQVLVRQHPIDTTAKKDWERLDSLIQDIRALNTHILSDPQLQITRRSDAEAQYLFEVANRIKTLFTDPLSRLPKSGRNSILEYIDRETILGHIWPDGVPEARIAIDTSGERAYEGPGATTLNRDGTHLEILWGLAEYTAASLKDVQQKLGPRLAQQQREQQQVLLEEQLVGHLDRLSRQTDTLKQDAPESVASALDAIRAEAERLVTAYSNSGESSDKSVMAENIAACLKELGALAEAVGSIPKQAAAIKEAYTDQIWNPFTATIMDESVKKRITGAYNDVLLSFILEQIQTNPGCESADEWNRILLEAYEKVLELREEDTAKLERKLRRERDPQKVLELFELIQQPNGE